MSGANANSNKTVGHKRTATEISKTKLDLLDKLLTLLQEVTGENQDDAKVDNLVTPSFIINAFKKVFEALLKEKKVSIHRQILKVFNHLICAKFTRNAMAEQLLFLLKPLTHHLTQSNSKTVNATKESIQLLMNEVLKEDNKKLIKLLFVELLRYATSSKKKIIRKYCWNFVHFCLESKYKIKQRTLKPPKDVLAKAQNEGNDTNKSAEKVEESERKITKKKKPSKSIMDALSNGLKQGLNDRDREVKVEAMNVLNLFSLLEETKADRLIAKMSTSTRKLFDSKYGTATSTKTSANNKSSKKKLENLKAPTKSTKKRSKSPAKKKKTKPPKGKRKSFSLKEDPESLKKSSKVAAKTSKKASVSSKKKKKSGKKKSSKKTKKTKAETKSLSAADLVIDKYALTTEEEDEESKQNNVDLDEVRNRRRQRRGGSAKKRSESTFGTADDLDFDLSALGGIDNDDDDDADGEEEEEAMDAGKDGDVRKESENEIYSSSTETYEGDNIEIYEFPRKDVLDPHPVEKDEDFSIDIERFLANNNAEYNWKFGNEEMIFFSNKQNAHALMSKISQIAIDQSGITTQEKAIEKLLQYDIDFDDLSLISDTAEFWPTDIEPNYAQLYNPKNNQYAGGDNQGDSQHPQHNFIICTQLSYNLMRLLTNEHQSDWIKQFIEECIYEICVHALCVFHPRSNGNVYHGRVILEVLLNHFPRDFLKYLVEDTKIIQPLLKYAIFNNIHHGNLNSFVMDLICFDAESIQQRDDIMYHEKAKMVTECTKYKEQLLDNIFDKEWHFLTNIMKRACSQHCNDVSTKYSIFFVDLVARCASIEDTKCLFDGNFDLIIDCFVNGLLGNELSVWQRIRCGQSLVEYLDLASRPTIMDPSVASTPFGFMQGQNAYKENIFFSSFKHCLSKLIAFIPDLCMLIVEDTQYEQIKFSYGDIAAPLGRLKLTALELLTVTIDFHEMNCSLVLRQIPMEFWSKIVEMVFMHRNNNMFLCHFRRLVHLAMIFRRRILKYLCVECKMIDRMVEFYQTNEQRSELHGYILQMLNDIYFHDSDAKHVN